MKDPKKSIQQQENNFLDLFGVVVEKKKKKKKIKHKTSQGSIKSSIFFFLFFIPISTKDLNVRAVSLSADSFDASTALSNALYGAVNKQWSQSFFFLFFSFLFFSFIYIQLQ
jgi:hypothetical protein